MAPENQCFRERHQRTNQHVAKNKSCRGEIPLYAAISFLLTAFGMGGMPPLGYTVRDRKLIIAEKGVGEGGTIGASAAVLNAVSDALAPFGVGIFEMPITPQRILQLLREAGCEAQ
jgi:hypothetical protein